MPLRFKVCGEFSAETNKKLLKDILQKMPPENRGHFYIYEIIQSFDQRFISFHWQYNLLSPAPLPYPTYLMLI